MLKTRLLFPTLEAPVTSTDDSVDAVLIDPLHAWLGMHLAGRRHDEHPFLASAAGAHRPIAEPWLEIQQLPGHFPRARPCRGRHATIRTAARAVRNQPIFYTRCRRHLMTASRNLPRKLRQNLGLSKKFEHCADACSGRILERIQPERREAVLYALGLLVQAVDELRA